MTTLETTTIDPDGAATMEPRSCRVRWAGLSGREHGDPDAAGPAFVLLHGLTFDRRMWDPVLDALPRSRRAIALDLPGHGGSSPLRGRGLAAAVDAVHEAVLEAGLESPILVGHSIGGPIASIYAASRPASGVVSVDTPLRFEPFAEHMRALRPQLAGDFDRTWARFRESMGIDRLTAGRRAHLHERASRELVLAYQADLLERPLAEVADWRNAGLRRLRDAGIPYVSLYAGPVAPEERSFVAERLPEARVLVWPVAHHFPHVAEPQRFARLLTTVAEPCGARPA
jgi:pimeloyl-ACP methyl ester carboxylesterase